MRKFLLSTLFILFVCHFNFAQSAQIEAKAETIVNRAAQNLGGEQYLRAISQIARGRYSILWDGALITFQSFVDVIVFPDKERTEFKVDGSKNVQTNNGEAGWIFDGAAQVINVQSKEQVENYKRGLRTSLDHLLRGSWRKDNAGLQYGGRRQAGVGRRNDVVKLIYSDGFTVEFEFSDDGMPVKSIYKRKNGEETVVEEDRYAQFVDVQGIKTPFIIDHFTNGAQTSRVNYEKVEFNKAIPEQIFSQPKSPKELKKDLKL